MSHENVTSDRQSHAATRNLMPHVLTTVELIKDPRTLGFGKWFTLVPHGNNEIRTCQPCRDLNSGSSGRILEGIIHELPQSELHEIGVDERRRKIRRDSDI